MGETPERPLIPGRGAPGADVRMIGWRHVLFGARSGATSARGSAPAPAADPRSGVPGRRGRCGARPSPRRPGVDGAGAVPRSDAVRGSRRAPVRVVLGLHALDGRGVGSDTTDAGRVAASGARRGRDAGRAGLARRQRLAERHDPRRTRRRGRGRHGRLRDRRRSLGDAHRSHRHRTRSAAHPHGPHPRGRAARPAVRGAAVVARRPFRCGARAGSAGRTRCRPGVDADPALA